jgi:hypothetical protein
LIASSSHVPSRRSARRETAWTSRAESTTRNVSPGPGATSERASSSSPNRHRGQTRATGAGGLPPGAGAAQWLQNQDQAFVSASPPWTSFSAGTADGALIARNPADLPPLSPSQL